MSPKTTIYTLAIVQLHRPYKMEDDLQHTTPLLSFESLTPFGSFHVGDGVAESGLRSLGRIQHIHHGIGDYRDEQILHHTTLYLHPDHD
jgi:hypothetical protein